MQLQELFKNCRQELSENQNNIFNEKSNTSSFLAVKLSFLNLNSLKFSFFRFEWFSYCFSAIGKQSDGFSFFQALELWRSVVL